MTRALFTAVLVLALAVASAEAGEPDRTRPYYDVALRGSDGGRAWTGRATISLRNPRAVSLERILIRLWGNGEDGCRAPRHVRISRLRGAVAGRLAVRCTAVPLRLDRPIAPGRRRDVSFRVSIRAPRRPGRFGNGGTGVWLFSNALPVLAHIERGKFRLDRYFADGEAWTYPAAGWNVRLVPPAAVLVAAPGMPSPSGTRTLVYGRDYSFAAGRMAWRQDVIDGVEVTVWGPDHADAAIEATLALVRLRLPQLAELYGPYGWPDLQVVLIDHGGMEHTGLIMTAPDDQVLTHELAHQWWYALIGSDQAAAPWLDEAFASFATFAAGAPEFYPCTMPGDGARIVTRGIERFRGHANNFFSYSFVYFEGACLLHLLRTRMGAAAFDAALRDYALANRYGWSTAAEFRAAMDAASPVRLGDLWRRYRVA